MSKLNEQYSEIVPNVRGMIFLATPHKGSSYAHLLNNILRAVPGSKAKAYIAELEKESPSLQDINEHFRHVCADLSLVSFHETLETSLPGGVKTLVSLMLGWRCCHKLVLCMH